VKSDPPRSHLPTMPRSPRSQVMRSQSPRSQFPRSGWFRSPFFSSSPRSRYSLTAPIAPTWKKKTSPLPSPHTFTLSIHPEPSPQTFVNVPERSEHFRSDDRTLWVLQKLHSSTYSLTKYPGTQVLDDLSYLEMSSAITCLLANLLPPPCDRSSSGGATPLRTSVAARDSHITP
jgi:hypothetical protein